MRLPGLGILKDKWVWMGLLAGGAVYLFTQHHGGHRGFAAPTQPTYDRPGLYEVPGGQGDFSHMRFSGQAELQRRLTIT